MNKRITNELMRQFSQYLFQNEKSQATQSKYLHDLATLKHFLGGRSISKEILIEYKSHCVSKGLAARSINSMLAAINSFLDMAGWGDCKVKNLRVQKKLFNSEDKELTRQEYMRLLSATKEDEQMRMILQTICSTGIRVSELKFFTVETVKNGVITINCKNKTRTILIPGKLKKMILDYAKKRAIASGVVFRGKKGNAINRSCVWRKMKHLCETAGVKETKVFPHNLRKLFARVFYSREKDIANLADILGHSSVNTTRIYIMTTGAEHRQKIEKLGLLLS